MKVLIFTPPSKLNYVRIGRCGGSTKSGTEFPPIKLMYAAGIARQNADILFIDADAEKISLEEFMQRVKKFSPQIAVAEPTPSSLGDEIIAVKKLKEEFDSIKIVFIGPFVSVVSQEISDKYPEIDYVIKGEAECALRLLFTKGQYNEQRALTENLDTLPFPVHDLIPKEKYISAFIKKYPYTIIETSRGCPFFCTYCNAFLSSDTKTRFRSVENIIQELRLIKSLGFKGLYFNDETFTLDKKRLSNLMDAMIKEKISFSWACNARVDTVDQEILSLMKKAGCNCVFYGVESGNQGILDYYKKGITLEQVTAAFKQTRQAGIETVAHFMIGAPEESWETIKNTIHFAKKINPDLASFNILTPYPGTDLFDDLKNRGLIDVDDWMGFDQSIQAGLKTNDLNSQELELGMKIAYRNFYYRPGYFLKKIFRIRSWQDIRCNMNGFLGLVDILKTK